MPTAKTVRIVYTDHADADPQELVLQIPEGERFGYKEAETLPGCIQLFYGRRTIIVNLHALLLIDMTL